MADLATDLAHDLATDLASDAGGTPASDAIDALGPWEDWRADTGVATGTTVTWTGRVQSLVVSATGTQRPTLSAADAGFNHQDVLAIGGAQGLTWGGAFSKFTPLHSGPFTMIWVGSTTAMNTSAACVCSTHAFGTTAVGMGFGLLRSEMSNGSGANAQNNPTMGAGYVANTGVWSALRWDGTLGASKYQMRGSTTPAWQSSTVSGTIVTTDPAAFIIGNYSGFGRGLNGKTARLSIFLRALSDAEVSNAVNNPGGAVPRYGVAA